MATVIEREWGAGYHPAHVSRLLRAIGWSRPKPIRRATQRDEAAIGHGGTRPGPPWGKEAAADGETVEWVDAAGFYLLPFQDRIDQTSRYD